MASVLDEMLPLPIDVHEQADFLQVVQVVGAGDHVFAGVEENGTVVWEE